MTSLDPIPRPFRAVPGWFVLNRGEIAALRAGDGPTFKRLMIIASQEDDADMLATERRRRSKRKSGCIHLSVHLQGCQSS